MEQMMLDEDRGAYEAFIAKRPRKIEYKISDLKTLFNQQQDYFSSYAYVQNTKKHI